MLQMVSFHSTTTIRAAFTSHQPLSTGPRPQRTSPSGGSWPAGRADGATAEERGRTGLEEVGNTALPEPRSGKRGMLPQRGGGSDGAAALTRHLRPRATPPRARTEATTARAQGRAPPRAAPLPPPSRLSLSVRRSARPPP